MVETWNKLIALGVPDGPIRPVGTGAISSAEAPGLLREVMDRGPAARECELLLAWLRAWRHHWPASFDEVLGEVGRDSLARLEQAEVDPNRYLKLRRIAIENLAQRL
jgi:hypothetical protein